MTILVIDALEVVNVNHGQPEHGVGHRHAVLVRQRHDRVRSAVPRGLIEGLVISDDMTHGGGIASIGQRAQKIGARNNADQKTAADHGRNGHAAEPGQHAVVQCRQRLEIAAGERRVGTAHGQRETSVVSNTTFERLSTQPQEIIRIRYDSRESLVAMGVIPDTNRRVPQPFPGSETASYVPDPPRRY